MEFMLLVRNAHPKAPPVSEGRSSASNSCVRCRQVAQGRNPAPVNCEGYTTFRAHIKT